MIPDEEAENPRVRLELRTEHRLAQADIFLRLFQSAGPRPALITRQEIDEAMGRVS